jgi:TATA-box binding protein (TBP) (component of TFIID and TFIIIB)
MNTRIETAKESIRMEVAQKMFGESTETELDEKVRQLKNPKTEMMIVKDGKVMVIDKAKWNKYEKMGYKLAEELDEDSMQIKAARAELQRRKK